MHAQAAALAEFRGDWAAAVKSYQAAYTELSRVNPAGPLPAQRWAELTAVAELINLKASSSFCPCSPLMLLFYCKGLVGPVAAAPIKLDHAISKDRKSVPDRIERKRTHWGYSHGPAAWRGGPPDCACACMLHAQVVTLLLHQQNVADALQQFRAHVGWLRAAPLPLPPAAAAAHALWVQRQYTVMGELLSTRIDAGLLPSQVRSGSL